MAQQNSPQEEGNSAQAVYVPRNDGRGAASLVLWLCIACSGPKVTHSLPSSSSALAELDGNLVNADGSGRRTSPADTSRRASRNKLSSSGHKIFNARIRCVLFAGSLNHEFEAQADRRRCHGPSLSPPSTRFSLSSLPPESSLHPGFQDLTNPISSFVSQIEKYVDIALILVVTSKAPPQEDLFFFHLPQSPTT
jgi:hypothetical protein